jgi:hypothetical protein
MVLSGLAFNKISDWSFDLRYPVTFNYNKLQDGDIVFLNFEYFLEFLYDISNKQNKKKFILISHNSDNSFTDEHYNMIKDYVYRVYAINNVCNNDNVVTIPLGFQDYPSNHFKLIVEMLLKSKKIEKKHLLYMNFSIHTNLKKRKECFETFKNYEWVTIQLNVSKEHFMKDMLFSKYVLSPEGTGIDCHRIYEAIACGSIPIIKKSGTRMDNFYENLPVVLIDDWKEITQEYLEENYNIYKSKLDIWLKDNGGWIHPNFWIQNIHLISFGCEKYTLTKLRLKKEAEESKFFSSINIYSPKDLGEDFEHISFIQNNPRGYGCWIWKLYFVLKKLRQMRDNDILIYADAGSSVNKNGKRRLNEYIDLLNKDDKDLLCFQMIHTEHKYTKNDIFNYFNIDDEHKKSGQIHATIFIVKKTNKLVQFLENMYHTISLNTHLIDDTKGITPNHFEFIDCRHDQSIFSVMVKQFYNHKVVIPEETWPPNGDWDEVSHVPILAKRLRY